MISVFPLCGDSLKGHILYDMHEDVDTDEQDCLVYDESTIPEVKLFRKFCRPIRNNSLPIGEMKA